jgi:hypothetical protein
MANWYTVVESKIVWAPIGTRVLKNGDEKTRFSRIGVKISMADGSWWFYSFRHDSWTQHFPLRPKLDRLGRPVVEYGKIAMQPEKKNKWANWDALSKDFGGRSPGLINALRDAVVSALEQGEQDAAEAA